MTTGSVSCPLLNHAAQYGERPDIPDGQAFDCPICGRYVTSGSLLATINVHPESVRRAVSWYTRERTESGESRPTLTTNNFRDIADSLTELPVIEKVDRYLRALAKYTPHPGSASTKVDAQFFEALLRAHSREEVKFLRNYLIDAGLAKPDEKGALIISVAGWQKLDRERNLSGRSGRAFVAMSFDPALNQVYEEGLKKAIEDVRFQPVRIDKVHHNEKICDRIIVEIRGCALLIADFTGHRQGVYFEAGYAMALGKPVVWCCRDSDFDKAHFDTRQYNHIVWSAPADLRVKLKERLQATMLPVDINPKFDLGFPHDRRR